MAIQWRLKVWQPNGTARATIPVDGAVSSLTRFSVDGAGNCLEAEWDADPSAVTIKARDIIQLDVSENSGASWTSVYKGIVTIAGSARADGLRSFKAVGLKERLYEVLITDAKIDSSDVATMVQDVLAGVTLPEGVTYASGDVPTQNFTLGDRYPAYESVGEFLQAMADTVGSFVVPTGETYTFSGTTYQAGEVVPATRWGVNAAGKAFFRRPQASVVTVAEGDAGAIVRWESVAGEEVWDAVTLVYAVEASWASLIIRSIPGNNALEYHTEDPVHPIARSFPEAGSTYGSEKIEVLLNPLDYMAPISITISDPDVTNPGNATDGSDSTYALLASGGDFTVSLPSSLGPCIFRMLVSGDTAEAQITGDIYFNDTGAQRLVVDFGFPDFPPDSLVEQLVVIPQPIDLAALSADSLVVRSNGSFDALRIYALEFLVPDVDESGTLSELLAEGYYRDPAEDASEVQLINQRGAVSQTISLTPDGESQIDLPIERVEYSLTSEDGLTTVYSLGQPFPAELMGQAVVLDRLIKRRQSR